MFGRKVARLMEWCAMVGCPIVGINDSGGARIQDAVTSLAWYAELGRRHELLSGLVPQISIILGKCAGGAVYSPIQTDLVVAVRDQGYMFVTGPDVIKDVTGEDVSLDELGAPTTRRATATSIRWWSPRPPHTSTCGTFCRFCRPTASTNRRSSTPGWNPKSPATIWNSTRSCRTRTTWPTTCTRSCCGSSTTATSRRRCPGRAGDHHRLRAGGRADRWCGGQPAHAHVGGDRQRGVRQGRTVHPV